MSEPTTSPEEEFAQAVIQKLLEERKGRLGRIESMLRELLIERREARIAALESAWNCRHQGYTEGWTSEMYVEEQRLHDEKIAQLRQIP